MILAVLIFLLCFSYALFFLFFFNDTATTESYTLSLHDALPISGLRITASSPTCAIPAATSLLHSTAFGPAPLTSIMAARSEEHTSELQSLRHLVCRLLLEKKNKNNKKPKLNANNLQTHNTHITA